MVLMPEREVLQNQDVRARKEPMNEQSGRKAWRRLRGDVGGSVVIRCVRHASASNRRRRYFLLKKWSCVHSQFDISIFLQRSA